MNIFIEVSIGEVIDKLSILQIKNERISDPEKVLNIRRELKYLQKKIDKYLLDNHCDKIHLFDKLIDTNNKLWDIEDSIRVKESKSEFDDDFIRLARLVYITNDIRAEIKKEINIHYGSNFIEEKSYNQ